MLCVELVLRQNKKKVDVESKNKKENHRQQQQINSNASTEFLNIMEIYYSCV